MSFFEELGLLDRPFVPIKVKIHNKEIELRARALSGKESDELEAMQMDEYGRVLSKLMESNDGAISELERVTRVYTEQPSKEVARQLVASRTLDVNARALEIAGIDFQKEADKLKELPEEERDAYAKEANEKWEAALEQSKSELQAELELMPSAELARQVAQVTINVRALRISRRMFNDMFLYYSLYEKDEEKKVFESRAQVGERLTAGTIGTLVEAVQAALKTDLPLESQGDSAPDNAPSLQNTSVEATADGGTPTTTTSDVSP